MMRISRRDTLRGMALAALMAQMPRFGTSAQAATPLPWKNWIGSIGGTPAQKAAPRTLDELAALMTRAPTPIRAAGSGHSWTELVPTPGTLLSMRHFDGVQPLPDNRARIGAGGKLTRIAPKLADVGQALFNMPDIDEQTLAGAFATATHGTGWELPALHDAMEALTLVTAQGEVIEASRTQNAEIFAAARVSLGALGIVADATLRNMPNYNVQRKIWYPPLDELFEDIESIAQNARTFECFYLPFSGHTWASTTDIWDGALSGRPPDSDAEAVNDLKALRDIGSWVGFMRRFLLKSWVATVEPETFSDVWWKIYPTKRTQPFYEMEYHVPTEVGPEVFRKIITLIETHHKEVFFPIEYRYVAPDDAWLSSFYGRHSVAISVHRAVEGEDPWKLFKPVEEIFRSYDGRPHWGKMHSLREADLAPLYPKWRDFRDVRRTLDPQGRLLNDYLRSILEPNA